MATRGLHKGSSGSPFHISEYEADMPIDPGDADYQSGPRVGAGVLGKRVSMEVSKNGNGRSGRRDRNTDSNND